MGMDIRTIIIAAPVIVFSLTVHEFFHAWMADKFGDSTAKDMGRLTLNPLAHLDLYGTLVMVMSQFRFGWAKPVPVNPYNLRNPRRDDFWISAAGPLSNLGLAFIAGTVFRIMNATDMYGTMEVIDRIVINMVLINLFLAFFNLLPIFPLDGSHIIRNVLPERYGPALDRFERVAPMILLFLIVGGALMGVPFITIIIWPFVKPLAYLFAGMHL